MQKKSESKFKFLKYNNLEDMLKLILTSSQSALGINSLLYYINYRNKNIFFIYNSSIGSSLIHYNFLTEKPKNKFIQLNKISGKYEFVNGLGTDSHSIYIPILELEEITLDFPI
ncbi:MAG: hypothetical protein ACE5SW_08235 [Nitrososphaeraceae archaeon]